MVQILDNMKDLVKLLLLIIPAMRDLLGSAKKETNLARKRRITRILEDQDLSKLEKLERILFRVGLEAVDILGFVKDGKVISIELIEEGTIVTQGFIQSYYRLGLKLLQNKRLR